MTKSQLLTLHQFDDKWRSLPVLKRWGVEGPDMLDLIEQGFVEVRVGGNEFYRISPAGWRELRKQRQEAE